MDNTSWDWPLAKGEAKDPLVPSDKKEIDGAKHWLRLPYLPWLATLVGGLATAKKNWKRSRQSRGGRHEEGTLEGHCTGDNSPASPWELPDEWLNLC